MKEELKQGTKNEKNTARRVKKGNISRIDYLFCSVYVAAVHHRVHRVFK